MFQRWKVIIIGLVVMMAIIAVFMTQFQWNNSIFKGIKSYNWPSVEGYVRTSNLDNPKVTSKQESLRLVYVYKVGDKEYEAYNLNFSRGLLPDAYFPEDVTPFHTGQRVMVYYNPENPNESTLMRGFYPVIGFPEVLCVVILSMVFVGIIVVKIQNYKREKARKRMLEARTLREQSKEKLARAQKLEDREARQYFSGDWSMPDGEISMRMDWSWKAEMEGHEFSGTWRLKQRQLVLKITKAPSTMKEMVRVQTIFRIIEEGHDYLELKRSLMERDEKVLRKWTGDGPDETWRRLSAQNVMK